MSAIDPQMLLGAGLFIGGLIGGIFGAKKLPWIKANEVACPAIEKSLKTEIPAYPVIEKSLKTSGALHISEEGLTKVNELTKELTEKYMTEKTHNAVCARQQAEIKLHISNVLSEQTKEIVDTIKRNGHGEKHDPGTPE